MLVLSRMAQPIRQHILAFEPIAASAQGLMMFQSDSSVSAHESRHNEFPHDARRAVRKECINDCISQAHHAVAKKRGLR